MGYGEYFRQLLRPLGLYDVDSGAGAGELEAMGRGLDGVYDRFAELERECIPATAEDWGLGLYEDILPRHPIPASVRRRRAAVMALLRIDGASFTLEAIRDTIAGCGLTAAVNESETPQTVEVSFPGVRGEPEQFDALKASVEQIVPCHLAVEYLLAYLLWQDIEDYAWTWGDIERRGLTWDGLERYCEEE